MASDQAAKKCNDEQISRMIIDAEADVNAKNANGATALEILLKKGSVEMETIKYFIESGYKINSFNSFTDEGIIPMILSKLSNNEVVTKLILSSPNVIELDEMGRSAIHNIVSAYKSSSWNLDYDGLIEEFEKLDCDVDHQDKLGATALHRAVQFRNNRAITALLAAGADINIIDGRGDTVYDRALTWRFFTPSSLNLRGVMGEDDEIDLFKTYVNKLRLAGIHVSARNEPLKKYADETHRSFVLEQQRFRSLFDGMEKAKIGSRYLTLCEVISVTADLRKYSKTTWADRDDMIEYFESILNANNDQRFGTYRCLVKLQHKNLLMRPKLVEAAKLALDTLSKIPMPDLCSEAIFASFENWELRNVIEATN